MSDKASSDVSSNEVIKSNIRMRANDLWPDFAPAEGELPPITILKEQASLLGLKLKNLVEAEVETGTTDYYDQRFLVHTLVLVAPVLNFFRYRLLEVQHSATELYPATVSSDDPANPSNIKAENQDEFKAALRNVFASAQTKRVIENLLAQSLGAKVGA